MSKGVLTNHHKDFQFYQFPIFHRPYKSHKYVENLRELLFIHTKRCFSYMPIFIEIQAYIEILQSSCAYSHFRRLLVKINNRAA